MFKNKKESQNTSTSIQNSNNPQSNPSNPQTDNSSQQQKFNFLKKKEVSVEETNINNTNNSISQTNTKLNSFNFIKSKKTTEPCKEKEIINTEHNFNKKSDFASLDNFLNENNIINQSQNAEKEITNFSETGSTKEIIPEDNTKAPINFPEKEEAAPTEKKGFNFLKKKATVKEIPADDVNSDTKSIKSLQFKHDSISVNLEEEENKSVKNSSSNKIIKTDRKQSNPITKVNLFLIKARRC